MTKAEAVKKATAKIKDIWQHNFCPQVFRGKDYPKQEINAEMAGNDDKCVQNKQEDTAKSGHV